MSRLFSLATTCAMALVFAHPAAAAEALSRAQVAEAVAARVQGEYVFVDKAAAAARLVRQRAASGAYARAADEKAFVDAVTADLFSVTQDKHLVVRWSAAGYPPQADEAADPAARAAALASMRRENFQMPKAEVLAGNIGYLKIGGFEGPEDAGPTLTAAMAFLANTDALIFDLRGNGGGDSATVALAISYLVPPQTKLVAFRSRESGSEAQSWSLPYVPGGRWSLTKPVYVLTDGMSFSAAEEFAFDLQQLKRGTIVGAQSRGGANPGLIHRIGEHYAMFVPNEAAVGPATGTNWEGTGVTPDVAVDPGEALSAAHRLALQALIKSANAEHKAELEAALADLGG